MGCGAIGLPLALALADRGRTVVGVEADPRRAADLKAARLPADPERLDLRLQDVAGRLQFTDIIPRSRAPRAFVVAVPTPVDEAGRFRDLDLGSAVQSIVARAKDGDLVIVRSTVPIGATRKLAVSHDPGGRLLWAACPDRSFAGRAFADQLRIPHIVGGLAEPAGAAASELFEGLCEVIQVSSPEAAEAAKLFLNVERDVRFAVANQFALICERTGVDFSEVRRAASLHSDFALPRPGPVGGPCLGKDTYLLLSSANVRGTGEMLAKARALNAGLARGLAEQILGELAEGQLQRRVAILGLAFKGAPAVTNRAGSFAVALGEALTALDPRIAIGFWDPVADPLSEKPAVLADAAVVVLANEHPDLADLRDVGRWCPTAVVHDMCGVTLGHEIPPAVDVRIFGDGAA